MPFGRTPSTIRNQIETSQNNVDEKATIIREYVQQCRNSKKNIYLKKLDLSNIDLSELDLSKQTIKVPHVYTTENGDTQTYYTCKILKVSFKNSDLSGANLENCDFREADLRGTNLSGANLKNCDFRGARLVGADLEGANTEDTIIEENANQSKSRCVIS